MTGAKGTFDLRQKKREILGINYAGLPIYKGESYGGRPEWTDPDCPEQLSGTGKRTIYGKRATVQKRVNMKQRGFGAGYWAELRASPEKMAEHLRKMREGQARRRAEKAARKKR